MVKIITAVACEACRGRGWVYGDVNENWPLYVFAPFSLGLSLLSLTKHECKACKGDGCVHSETSGHISTGSL